MTDSIIISLGCARHQLPSIIGVKAVCVTPCDMVSLIPRCVGANLTKPTAITGPKLIIPNFND